MTKKNVRIKIKLTQTEAFEGIDLNGDFASKYINTRVFNKYSSFLQKLYLMNSQIPVKPQGKKASGSAAKKKEQVFSPDEFTKDDYFENLFGDSEDYDIPYKLTYETDAELVKKGNRISLKYDDSELSDFPGSYRKIEFDERDRSFLFMEYYEIYGGMVSHFSAGQRCRQDIVSPMYNILVSTYTSHLKNTLTEKGGDFEIKFEMEINGRLTEKIELNIKVALADDGV